MNEAKQTNLIEQPEIQRLLSVLAENHLSNEQEQIESIVIYLDNMENQFGQVLSELKQVREQLDQIQDRGIKATVTQMVEKAEGKAHEIGNRITEIKRNLIAAAQNAVSKFREKGVGALQKTIEAMRIPSVLSHLREGLHQSVESMKRQAVKIGEISKEVQEMRTHRKNIGRLLLEKPKVESEVRNTDQGALAKIQRGFLRAGKILAGMEKGAVQIENRIDDFQNAKKGSVREELKRIQGKQGRKQSKSVPVKQEQER